MKFTKKPWTMEEEREMLASLRKKETFEQIAQRHDRTTNAIKLRFGMVCRKDLETTPKSVGDLSQEYRIPESRILQYIEDLETIQKKNQTLTSPVVDPADISIIKEEILIINEKLDKIHRYVKKLMDMTKKTDPLSSSSSSSSTLKK